MYNLLKIITNLFKGFPFWFGADKQNKMEEDWNDIYSGANKVLEKQNMAKIIILDNLHKRNKF